MPANATFGQSSIIIEGGYLCGNGKDKAEIVLEQIPNQLIIKNTIQLMGLGYGSGKSMVKVGSSVNLSGGAGTAMAMAARTPQVLSFAFGGVWGAPQAIDGPFRLPQALWPHVTPSHAVYAQGPPTEGYWRIGQVVWRALTGIPDGSISVPQYDPFQKYVPPAPGAPIGWVCTFGGQPGQGVNVSSPLAAAAPAPTTTPSEERSNRELEGLRAEVAELREAVRVLGARKTDDGAANSHRR